MQEIRGCQPDKAVSRVFGKFSNRAKRAFCFQSLPWFLYPTASADGLYVLKTRQRSPEQGKDLPQGQKLGTQTLHSFYKLSTRHKQDYS